MQEVKRFQGGRPAARGDRGLEAKGEFVRKEGRISLLPEQKMGRDWCADKDIQ